MHALRNYLAIAVLVAPVATACGDDPPSIDPFGDGDREVVGSGDVVVTEREVAGLRTIDLLGVGEVVVTQGERESLTVETDDNLQDLVLTGVSGGVLRIRIADRTDIEPTVLVYRVEVVELDGMRLTGVGSFEIDAWAGDSVELDLRGVGDIEVGALDAEEVSVRFAGVGDVSIAGTVGRQDVVLSGVGDYAAADLRSGAADLEVSGVSDATLWVTDTLDVVARGQADIGYYGSPEVDPRVTGSATLRSLGER